MDVRFEEIKYEDIELVRKWRNSKEVSQFMYTDNYITRENQILWFQSIVKSNSSNYWIIYYKNSKIGLVNLSNINYELKSCNWAFYIGDINFRDSGVAAICEYNLIEKVFFELNFNSLECEVLQTNSSVINLHRRFGFLVNSEFESFIFKSNKSIAIVKLELSKERWMLIKSNLQKIIFRI